MLIINSNTVAASSAAALITLMSFNFIRLCGWQSKYHIVRIIYAITIYIISLCVPLYHGCTLVTILRGVLSDMSITTFVVLLYMLLRNIFMPHKTHKLNIHFVMIIVIFGALLYLSALGFFAFDIYDLGYLPSGWLLLGFIGVELLLSDYARSYAWLWLLALTAFYFKIQCSNNLWDYLFDPVLWIMSIISLFRHKQLSPHN